MSGCIRCGVFQVICTYPKEVVGRVDVEKKEQKNEEG